MEIKNSYLMWIGSDSYGGISDWVDEATEKGISKRLPNVETGLALRGEGTAIFVAHDEGERIECAHCQGKIECPACRKRNQETIRLRLEIESVAKEPESAAKSRFIDLREGKIAALDKDFEDCEGCHGTQEMTAGSGGSVTLESGEVWDYRKYTYWRNQPKKWNYKEHVTKVDMCVHCGGFGQLPDGKVFGLFLPDDVEYILSGDDSEKALELTKISESELLREPRRMCGRRVPGGTYAVTSKEGDPARARSLVETLVKEGKIEPDAVEVCGSFIKFLEPIKIAEKRFRGIKRWALHPAAEDAAEMALDGLE